MLTITIKTQSNISPAYASLLSLIYFVQFIFVFWFTFLKDSAEHNACEEEHLEDKQSRALTDDNGRKLPITIEVSLVL